MQPALITPAELGLPETMPLPKRKDWGIGVVGFGHIARAAHVPDYRRLSWSVVAAADPDPAARSEAGEKFGVPRVYADYRQLIADDTVEVVDLCTQPNVREEVVQAAAEAGKHVITEKPFAMNLKECERMVEIADRCGIKLAVHQNYRWMKTNYLVHHIVRCGYIGQPFFASIEIFGGQDVGLANHPFYQHVDDFMTVQWDNHLADLLRFWTGRNAVRVFARAGRMKGQNLKSDLLLTVITDFGEGVTGHMMHHELLRSSLGGAMCRVDGDEGSLVFDFWSDQLEMESSVIGGGVRTVDLSGTSYPPSFAGSMGDFLSAIEEDREPMVSGRRNLATIRTILAEDESARAGGKWVSCSIPDEETK